MSTERDWMETVNSFKIQHITEEVVIPLCQYSSDLDSNLVDLFLPSVQGLKRIAWIFKTSYTFCTGVNISKQNCFVQSYGLSFLALCIIMSWTYIVLYYESTEVSVLP